MKLERGSQEEEKVREAGKMTWKHEREFGEEENQ